LATLLGLTIEADNLLLTDPLPQPPVASLSPDQVVEIELSARIDLKAARQATAVAEERVREEFFRVFPNIELGPFLERNERRALPGRNIPAGTAR
jgi:outer membrane protein, heavy metal efflux system